MRKRLFTYSTAFLLVGLVAGLQIGSAVSGDDTFSALKKVEDAFLIIKKGYVDDPRANEIAERAISGMLKDLDPHSVYITAEQMRQVSENFNASFEGIGITYEFIEGIDGQDTLTVINVIPGGPSDEAGLMSGDRILDVDGKSAIGFTADDVQDRIKGPRGTRVRVKVKRPRYHRQIDFTIRRDQIPIHTLDAAYMMDGRTGYIRLNRFARTTHAEFAGALRRLKDQGMNRLVLDLRSNPGGYMDQAIHIADEFLGAGRLIVSQRGRAAETSADYEARDGGLFETQPVVVLVNGESASASEIVAGALQDHDRALIVGQRTYGKGLVQQQFPLHDGSVLRMTTARYYTPAGRLIQTPYENNDQEDYYTAKLAQRAEDNGHSIHDIMAEVPDSLKYTTAGGRTVLGGGGILPDYLIYPDSLSPFMREVLDGGIVNEFVRAWLDENGPDVHTTWGDRQDDFIHEFAVDARMIDDFYAFAGQRGLAIGTTPKGDAPFFARADVEVDQPLLTILLKGRLAVRLYEQSAWYPVYQARDRVLQGAMQLWDSAENMAVNTSR